MPDLNIKDLIEKYLNGENYYQKDSYNESECRQEFIDRFLVLLGWDVYNEQKKKPQFKEVLVEKYEPNMKRPDYTITINGTKKFFIEAKKPYVDLSQDPLPAIQARQYGWNANHSIVVLTNFRQLYIYDTTVKPSYADSVNTCLYRKYDLTNLEENFSEILALIGKLAVYHGSLDKIKDELSAHHETTPVDQDFLREINNWRVELANELFNSGKEKFQDINYLNESIQRFINRIVFLRICEDREIETYQKLIQTTADEPKLKAQLETLFKKSDEKFAAGLFSEINPTDTGIVFDLDNKAILKIIKALYYPQSIYLFNIIEPSILGKIYEIYLAEKLETHNGSIILAKKKDRQNKAIVTTPVEIVDFIVNKTVSLALLSLTPEQIFKTKTCDICCGSGVFLEEAFDAYVNQLTYWYQHNQPEILERSNTGDAKLPFSIKKKVLTSCIYGVDIDYQAVEVCRFSLLIKLLEGESNESIGLETPILPDLTNNIQCGNSLVERRNSPSYSMNELLSINPFDWSLINNGEKFTCIIGNPPYVKTEDMHNILPQKEFDYYLVNYKTSYKQFDKYFLFLEKALQLKTNNGYLGFIIPNKFQKISTAKKVRKLLLDAQGDVTIVDFGSAQLFDEKTIYSAILTVDNSDKKQISFFKCENLLNLAIGALSPIQFCKKSELSDEIWYFSPKSNFPSIKLTNVVQPINGIQTSMENPHVYWLSDEDIIDEDEKCFSYSLPEGVVRIEKDILKPYFKPTNNVEKNISSYDKPITNKKIIFPYYPDGKLIPIETMKSKYPCCWEYLCSHYDLLVPKSLSPTGRRNVQNATKDTWYMFGRTQNLTEFNGTKKIIVKNMFSDNPMFSIDYQGDLVLSSGGTAGYSALKLLSDTRYSIEYIHACLNSKNSIEIFKAMGSEFDNGFYAIGTSKLKLFKIPSIDFESDKERSIHDKITSLTRDALSYKEQLSESLTGLDHQILETMFASAKKGIEEQLKILYER